MRRIFVDTSYYVALLFTGDPRHELAGALAMALGSQPVRLVTSWAVILEVLAWFSRKGPSGRVTAAGLVGRLKASRAVEIVDLTNDVLDEALSLYRSRADKRYSLADCTSMVIAKAMGITEILTTDRDFQAEGFTILMPE